MTLEIMKGALPGTLEGTPLDHNSLHDQLALPIQHFIEKHPNKSKQDLVAEVCEVVAELVCSSGFDWPTVRHMGDFALQTLSQEIPRKFHIHDRIRRQRM
jgi:hypothetical protein